MDHLIYTAMTGAKYALERQAANANNLANVSTTGFKAEVHRFRAVPIESEAFPTRAFVVDATVGTDFAPGTIQQTGRPLDVAIEGQGWLSVQAADGSEAYTRNGSLTVTPEGQLQTRDGQAVLGEGGPITMPPNSEVSIGRDGMISLVSGGIRSVITTLDRLKLVNPPSEQLERGADGLYRLPNGQTAEAAPAVQVQSGALESSNVSVVEALVNMISLSRQFEMNVKLLQDAESNERLADQVLTAR